MTDRIDFGGDPWRAIPNRILRDPRLSPRAKGGLVTLLSHEEGWVRSCIAVLQHENVCGRKQAQAIMAELRDLGYAQLVHDQEPGVNLRKTHYVVSIGASSQPDLSTAPTYPEPGGSETGRVGVGSAVVEALEEETLDEEPKEVLAPATRPRDHVWDVLVAIYGEPTAPAKGAYNAAAKTLRDYGADPDEIAQVYRELRGTTNGWAVATPTSMAKHFGERQSLVDQLKVRVPDRGADLMREARDA